MKQYIDKEALIALIKKIYNEYYKFLPSDIAENIQDFKDDVLRNIDTLEVKEVDLDYIKKELDELIRIHKPDGDFGWGTLHNVATHFFELGLKAKGE